MKSIVIFNQKGGVGKTTTVANIMAEMTARGKKVLALDLDAQGNLTRFLDVRTDGQNTVRELLLKEATFEETVVHTKYGDLIPSDEALQGELLRFASMPAFIISIRTLITKLTRYDIILMDCAPSPNQLSAAALVATDYVIIPTEAEYFSADGVKKIAETINQVRQMNPTLDIMGLLVVKYNQRRSLTKTFESVLEKQSKDLLDSRVFESEIRFTVDIPTSQAYHLSVRDYKPNSGAAEDYRQLTDEILHLM